MIKVGNQTNSQDPQAVNSRVFVGNLNTFQATKTDVERLFQRYGRIAGISMHKGFAFIQFTNPFDARSACVGEDGRSIFGQVLDVNMVAEPKPAQNGRKRQQQLQQKKQQQQASQPQTANDWIYAAAAANPFTAAAAVRLAAASPPMKRARVIVPPPASPIGSPRTVTAKSPSTPPARKPQGTICLDDLKTYSSPDILICGNCREMFGDVMDMLDHKRACCKLRFVCKCSDQSATNNTAHGSSALACALCKEPFTSAWDLMAHFQTAHNVNIYRLGSPPKDIDTRSETAGSDTSGRDAELKTERTSSEEMQTSSGIPNGEAPLTANGSTTGGASRAGDNLSGVSPLKALAQQS